ncbi:MAG: hypothetical protein O7C58_05100 [Rickettsia endosymbiont of Ixodes persulcatus]|nr:hypothetical protein [Rickettsia endosymbiont of Ixodes persulcatus]MCZ6910176.1 hypothetical protein [Rickettsia endosymbiont of Ixodes persulcatus]MCZ6924338.1 hypothetical protein [Rickettsia endosymbiont of Ixodes persulcatus]
MISFMVSKAQLIRVAIKNYLRELKKDKKDKEDAEIALERRNNNSDKLLTSEEAAELLKNMDYNFELSSYLSCRQFCRYSETFSAYCDLRAV